MPVVSWFHPRARFGDVPGAWWAARVGVTPVSGDDVSSQLGRGTSRHESVTVDRGGLARSTWRVYVGRAVEQAAAAVPGIHPALTRTTTCVSGGHDTGRAA